MDARNAVQLSMVLVGFKKRYTVYFDVLRCRSIVVSCMRMYLDTYVYMHMIAYV